MFETLRSWQRRTFPRFNSAVEVVAPRPKRKLKPRGKDRMRAREPESVYIDFEPSPQELERRNRVELERMQRETEMRNIRNELPYGTPSVLVDKFWRGQDMHLFELGKKIKQEHVSRLSKVHFKHMFDMRMELVSGHDEILERLATLEEHKVACIRFRRWDLKHCHDLRSQNNYRFRRWINFGSQNAGKDYYEAYKCSVENRDYYERAIFDHQKDWYKSCFSNWREDIRENIKNMYHHDVEEYNGKQEYFAEEMIIVNASDNIEEKAWLYLQDELYLHEKMHFYQCHVYDRLQKESKLYAYSPWFPPEPEQTTLDSYLANTGSEPEHSNAYWDIPF